MFKLNWMEKIKTTLKPTSTAKYYRITQDDQAADVFFAEVARSGNSLLNLLPSWGR